MAADPPGAVIHPGGGATPLRGSAPPWTRIESGPRPRRRTLPRLGRPALGPPPAEPTERGGATGPPWPASRRSPAASRRDPRLLGLAPPGSSRAGLVRPRAA